MNQRHVAITGGARGIGRATAAAFIAAGAKVVIGDLDSARPERAAAELPGCTAGLPLDVTDRSSFAEFLDRAETELGGLDVLVNNAGIMPTGPFLDESDEMTDRMIAVNLRGVLTGTRLAANRFVERHRPGCIVNVASFAGQFGAPAIATYAGTKAAVIIASESLAIELAPNRIHVAVVLPGVVRTELSAGANYPKWLERFVAVDPEDVASAIVDAVDQRKPYVPVPPALDALVKVRGFLPAGMRRRLEQRVGLDRAFSHADPAARARYHHRLNGTL